MIKQKAVFYETKTTYTLNISKYKLLATVSGRVFFIIQFSLTQIPASNGRSCLH